MKSYKLEILNNDYIIKLNLNDTEKTNFYYAQLLDEQLKELQDKQKSVKRELKYLHIAKNIIIYYLSSAKQGNEFINQSLPRAIRLWLEICAEENNPDP